MIDGCRQPIISVNGAIKIRFRLAYPPIEDIVRADCIDANFGVNQADRMVSIWLMFAFANDSLTATMEAETQAMSVEWLNRSLVPGYRPSLARGSELRPRSRPDK